MRHYNGTILKLIIDVNCSISEWKIEICFFTLSCRIDLCLIIIFITNLKKKPQKTVTTKYQESFRLSQNGIEIFGWVKMERTFSLRTVCSLVCKLSQSRSGPSTYLVDEEIKKDRVGQMRDKWN